MITTIPAIAANRRTNQLRMRSPAIPEWVLFLLAPILAVSVCFCLCSLACVFQHHRIENRARRRVAPPPTTTDPEAPPPPSPRKCSYTVIQSPRGKLDIGVYVVVTDDAAADDDSSRAD